MSSKKTTTSEEHSFTEAFQQQQQYQQQVNTAAPPSWTQAGISDVASRVMAALNKVPQYGYSGDFVAQGSPGWFNNSLSGYINASQAANQAGATQTGWASQLAGAMPQFSAAPQLSTMQDLLALAPTAAQLGGQGNVLAAPDFKSMLPTMAARPDFVGFTPQDFQSDDGGTRLDAALSAATQPFVRELTSNILPSIQSSAIQAGAYSGGRAMNVLPSQAIADTATRANEVSQGLAYQGFQSEENRRAQAWATMQGLLSDQAAQQNQFNTTLWSGENDFNSTMANILAQTSLGAYQTQQQATTANANRVADALVSMYNTNSNAMLQRDRNAIDVWGMGNNNAIAADEARRANYGAASNLMQTGLQDTTAVGDIAAQVYEMTRAREQLGIDNMLQQQQYAVNQPFQGLDLATQLLTQLSQNWGTQTSEGSANMTGSSTSKTDSNGKQVQTSSGLGGIVQGIAGLASIAGGLGLFGPIGPLATAASGALKAGGAAAAGVGAASNSLSKLFSRT